MTEKIYLITTIRGNTLITPGKCWQFRVVSAAGDVLGEQSLFYTPEAAEKAGREWVRG